MKTSTLSKIKKENARLERVTPYNSCDRWCEKCAKKRRAMCKVYHEEFHRKLQHVANGRDPDDIYVMLADFEKDLKKSKNLIDDCSRDEGVDLSILEPVEESRSRADHPLHKLGSVYMEKVRDFLRESYDEDGCVEDPLFESYETIHWYYMPIRTKSSIILWNMETATFSSYCHAVSQIKILRKACRESRKALEHILLYNFHQRYEILDILDIISQILGHVKTIETEIDKSPL